MTQHVLKGISVKAVPDKGTCRGCLFKRPEAPSCPSYAEELMAGLNLPCYDANVIYVEDKK